MTPTTKHKLVPVAYEVIDIRHAVHPSTPITIIRSWDRAEATERGALCLYPKIPKDWDEMWCVRLMGMVLERGDNEIARWVWEPSPSNREWAFIERTRYKTAQAAYMWLKQVYKR